MLQPHSYLLIAHFWTLWSHHCSAISREYKLTLQISTLISAVMKTKQLNVHDFHLHFSFNYFWNSLCLLWKLIFIKVIIKRCLPKLLNYFNISKIYTSSCGWVNHFHHCIYTHWRKETWILGHNLVLKRKKVQCHKMLLTEKSPSSLVITIFKK